MNAPHAKMRGWSFGRMSTCLALLTLAACLLTPSSSRSLSLNNRVLQILREPAYASELLRETDSSRNRDTRPTRTVESTDSMRETSLGGDTGVGKRQQTPRWLLRPNRRGRLSIGMTLDALSDMLSAERRRHYRMQALKAQNNLHRLGKRDVRAVLH